MVFRSQIESGLRATDGLSSQVPGHATAQENTPDGEVKIHKKSQTNNDKPETLD